MEMSSEKKTERRPNLSMLALVSFIASFTVARIFTSLRPDVIVMIGGVYHIHHFWYGIIMLAIGGWLGISYNEERINRLAAILFGAGGGFIGDEVGLLLTFGDYRTGITYTFIIIFTTFISILILLNRYSRIISREFTEFSSSQKSIYFGVFLAAVSIVFITESDDIIITAVASVSTIVAFVIILAYFIQRIRRRNF